MSTQDSRLLQAFIREVLRIEVHDHPGQGVLRQTLALDLDPDSPEVQRFLQDAQLQARFRDFLADIETLWQAFQRDSSSAAAQPVTDTVAQAAPVDAENHEANGASVAPTASDALDDSIPVLQADIDFHQVNPVYDASAINTLPHEVHVDTLTPSTDLANSVSTDDQSAATLAARQQTLAQTQLPTACAGQPYTLDIETTLSAPDVTVTQVDVPENCGLTFDAATGTLAGCPLESGTIKLVVHCLFDQVSSVMTALDLPVQPDPQSLWQVNEPEAGPPFVKPHLASTQLMAPPWQLIAASRRGRAHEHAGTFRDDDFVIDFDEASGFGIMIVADGAGSAPYSREGARLAAQATASGLRRQLAQLQADDLQKPIQQWSTLTDDARRQLGIACFHLFRQAATQAVDEIERRASELAQRLQQSCKPRDFATTLLGALFLPTTAGLFVATCWIGDGAIAVYGPRGKVRLMGRPDSGEFAGQTQFLDRSVLHAPDFGQRIGMGCFQDIDALVLMTDGVSDPKFETDRALQDPTCWDQLWDELKPVLADPQPAQALTDWLHFFIKGHHDDRTLAVLWQPGHLVESAQEAKA